MIKNREIALCILLSFLTCGIYALYWLSVLADDINTLYGDPNATSGPMVVLLSIITCGIYLIYWFYVAGQKINEIDTRNGRVPASSSLGLICLLLEIFGLAIISLSLLQNEVNKYANA